MKKDEIKQKRPFAPGIQWQLMLFIGGIIAAENPL